MRSIIPVVAALAWLTACGPSGAQKEESLKDSVRTMQADSDSIALAAYDSTVFDTIKWKKANDEMDRGSLVYNVSCAKCHGQDGGGMAQIVFRGDTLHPTSFLNPDWALADSVNALRRVIFTGGVGGMPHFGIIGLHYRDVEAVANYILKSLRPQNMKADTAAAKKK